jgi:large subunit ribosomal protein L9
MQVILVRSVRKLGKIGDTVEVKAGFGRNFLIPQGFAVRATESNQQMIVDKKQEFEAKNQLIKAQAEELSNKIVGKDFTFIRQSAADGRLFGSVGNKEVAKVLQEAGYEIGYRDVDLDKPIKALGVYDVSLILHTDVMSRVVINVARSDSEALDAIRDFKLVKEEPEVAIIDGESAA